MSEKSLWNWINNKMEGYCGWDSHRIENCSSKGILDTVVRVIINGVRYSCMVELKDWTSSKKHPLTIEQKNFIDSFGGIVLIKTGDKSIHIVPGCKDLTPLLSCDLNWAIANGVKISMSSKTVQNDLSTTIMNLCSPLQCYSNSGQLPR